MHGLTGEPPPAVSSYVGYSLDAPWGQPRIVFGICAEEAEQLAVLLAQHDCVGPVHAAARKSTGTAPDQAAAPEPAEPARPEADQPTVVTQPVVAQPVLAAPPGPAAFLHVPAPAPASAGQQPLPAAATARSSARSALTSPTIPRVSGIGTPIALAASRAVEASMASRRKAGGGSSGGSAASSAQHSPPAEPSESASQGDAEASKQPAAAAQVPLPAPPGGGDALRQNSAQGERAEHAEESQPEETRPAETSSVDDAGSAESWGVPDHGSPSEQADAADQSGQSVAPSHNGSFGQNGHAAPEPGAQPWAASAGSGSPAGQERSLGPESVPPHTDLADQPESAGEYGLPPAGLASHVGADGATPGPSLSAAPSTTLQELARSVTSRAGLSAQPGLGASPETASAAGQATESARSATARAGLGVQPIPSGSPEPVSAAGQGRIGTALQAGPGGPATLLAAQPAGWFGLVGQTSPVGQAASAGRSAEPVTQAFAARQLPPDTSPSALGGGSASDAIDRPTAVDAAIGLGMADDRPEKPAPDAPGIVAFRPRPEIPAGDVQTAQAADADRARIGRVLRGASLSRLKRPGAPADRSPAASEGTGQRPDRPEGERDWNAAAASADAATWAAGELPGQAAITDTAV